VRTVWDGTVSRSAGGIVVLQLGRTVATVLDPDLADSDPLNLAIFDDWGVAAGEESSMLMFFDQVRPTLTFVTQLARLSFEGSYDPGGFHRVKFHEVDPGRCLVETEAGVCLIDQTQTIRWNYVHDDVTCRVATINEVGVVLESEWDRSVLDLGTGRFISSEPIE
jgi:hypothetical protein